MSVSSQAFRNLAQRVNQQRLQPQPIIPQMPNRYTRTRTRPVNPGGPVMRPTNPAITNPNVRIGTPVQQPGMPQFTPPPLQAMPFDGTNLGGPQMQPTNPAITNPNVSIGTPVQAPGGKSFGDVVSAGGGLPGYIGQQVIQQNPNDPYAQNIGNIMTGIGNVVQPVFGFMGQGVNQALIGQENNPNYQPTQQQSFQDYQNAVFGNQPNIYQPNFGGNTGVGGKSSGFQPTQATQQNPNVSIGFGGQGMASQAGPQTGGFNPSLGNTTLPGNF